MRTPEAAQVEDRRVAPERQGQDVVELDPPGGAAGAAPVERVPATVAVSEA